MVVQVPKPCQALNWIRPLYPVMEMCISNVFFVSKTQQFPAEGRTPGERCRYLEELATLG